MKNYNLPLTYKEILLLERILDDRLQNCNIGGDSNEWNLNMNLYTKILGKKHYIQDKEK